LSANTSALERDAWFLYPARMTVAPYPFLLFQQRTVRGTQVRFQLLTTVQLCRQL